MTLRRKLRTRCGTTLTELLVAMAILGLLTLAITTGINASMLVYRKSVLLSESQVLFSTLSQALMDELRFAQDIQADGSFTSPTCGAGSRIMVHNGQIQCKEGFPLIGSDAYIGLTVKAEGTWVRYGDGLFTVNLILTYGGEQGEEIQAQSFTVRPLNPIE